MQDADYEHHTFCCIVSRAVLILFGLFLSLVYLIASRYLQFPYFQLSLAALALAGCITLTLAFFVYAVCVQKKRREYIEESPMAADLV